MAHATKNGFGLFAFLLLFSSAAFSSTYYVATSGNDAGSGTQAQPWRTIQKAANTLVAGDTAIVAAGTYNESVSTTKNGTASARISFVASGTVKTNGWSILNNYITMNGFSLSGAEITISSRGGSNGSYCEVLNNDITAGSISMAFKSAPTQCLIKGNRLHGMVSPKGDAPQIQVWGTNNRLEKNEIGPNADIDAFRFWGSGHVIRDNYIHDTTYSPSSLAHSDGFQTFGDNGDEAHDIVIENNRFINSQGQLFNTSQDNVAGIHDITVRNNVFANYSQNANIGLPNFYFYNNTLYNTGILYQVTGGPGQPFNGSNFVAKNNVFVGIAGCANADFDNVYNNPSNLPMARANNFYASCSGGALRNYRTESGGINGGAIDFKNPAGADFSLKPTSVVINKGVVLSGFNYDLLGNARGASWDMGAYEYVGAAGTPSPSPISTPAPSATPLASPTPGPTATLTPPASTPAPTSTPSSWVFCANEGGYCSFTGTRIVRYGAQGKYVTKTLTGGTPCTNEVFGDPIVNVAKVCELAVTASATSTPEPTTTPSATPTPTATTAPAQRLFTSQTPALKSNNDGVNYELGLRFTATVPGQITGVRFYKSPSESGTHTGKIYATSGALLGSVTFTGETASGWQDAKLASPITITANTEYVVTVNTGNKYYVATVNGLATQVTNGNLRSILGNNGVYGPVGSKPAKSYNNTNYFRDITFIPAR